MGEVSKTNQGPKQIEKDRERMVNLLNKKSKHFAEGSRVIVNGKPGEILWVYCDHLLVVYDDNYVGFVVNPSVGT